MPAASKTESPEILRVVPLKDAARLDTSLLGGKTANMVRLQALGIEVPRGFALTTACYREFVTENGMESRIASILGGMCSMSASSLGATSRKIQEAFVAARKTSTLENHISEAFENINSSVAVRSSANAEDMADASFAGLHDSFLNVTNLEALRTSIVGCWSSLWTERAIAYRTKFGIPHRGVEMGVLIHEFLPALKSGVLFTQNPTTGSRKQMVINATVGSAESLVGGTITPDVIVVNKDSGGIVQQAISRKSERLEALPVGGIKSVRVDATGGMECCLNADEIRQLIHLGELIEHGFGCPMDIEWVCNDSHVRVVQARPISVAGEERRDRSSNRFAQKLRRQLLGLLLDYFPSPMYPFDRGTLLSLIGATMRKLEEPGLKLPSADECFPLRRTGEIEPNVSLPKLRFSSLPRFVGFLWRLKRESRTSPGVFVQRYLPKLQLELKSFPSSLEELQSAQLAALFTKFKNIRDEVFLTRGGYFWSGWISIALVQLLLKASYGQNWGDVYFSLTSGIDLPTAEIKRDMEVLQRTLNEGTRRLISPDSALPDDFDRVLFDKFILQHGSRTFDMIPMPTSRCWRESPEMVAQMISKASISHDGTLSRWHDEKMVPNGFAGFLIRRLLTRVLEMTLERDNVIRAYEEATVPLRAIMREVGRRLEENSSLLSADDVGFLDPVEAFEALLHPENVSTEGLRVSIIDRQFARPTTIQNWRRPMQEGSTKTGVGGATVLRGLSASPGVVSGRAVIVLGEDDFEKIKDGDILVCVASSPAWTLLFGRVSAVVADLGGPLSHAAIVAREFGIPAVLDTKCATTELREGATYVVDGTHGLVLHPNEKDNE